MNSSILHKEVQEFIDNNLNADITKLLLKGIQFEGVSTKALVEQIEAKKRSQKKLPTWFSSKGIYYPNKLNIEQTSSEITAKYKSSLVSGKSIVDITGGFGIDCFYFSKHIESVTHCEINADLSEIVTHNYNALGVSNVETISSDGISYLKETDKKFDWIYIDPSRRHDVKGKVFFLSDCLPNVPEHLDLLFERTDNILVKTSPLLDISSGIKELKQVKAIHVVAVNNEVKELLWVLEKDVSEAIMIKTINIKKEAVSEFEFLYDAEKDVSVNYDLPQQYLYEPNAAILKAGAFKSIAKAFDLNKLHAHTHLYSSNMLISFPGRRFKIDKVLPFNKKRLKYERISMVNIATRNFPESAEKIKKRFHLKDGGRTFLFFTTNVRGEKIILVCSKVE
ncbi:class I SAM-dependent methyltransferase [Winogradskyella sp. 3972H.M.0a.05]|uniref:class I SAM-dependent methyltransferase n=1 Tax=Winogradskyella sp. 3972H.M.0a.05 TaxID=2950277 RepID=UPI003396EA19